jgi:hypothetical protein
MITEILMEWLTSNHCDLLFSYDLESSEKWSLTLVEDSGGVHIHGNSVEECVTKAAEYYLDTEGTPLYKIIQEVLLK